MSTLHRGLTALFASVLIVATIAAAPTPAPPLITLYAQDRYEGTSLQLVLPAVNLRAMGFTNPVVSLIVQHGRWQLCTQANFKGSCITVGPGKYPGGYHNGFSTHLVSLQPLGT